MFLQKVWQMLLQMSKKLSQNICDGYHDDAKYLSQNSGHDDDDDVDLSF